MVDIMALFPRKSASCKVYPLFKMFLVVLARCLFLMVVQQYGRIVYAPSQQLQQAFVEFFNLLVHGPYDEEEGEVSELQRLDERAMAVNEAVRLVL